MNKIFKALPFKCPSCGSVMVHKIGTYHLQCQNCKSTKAIDLDNTPKSKYPLNSYIDKQLIVPTPKTVDCLGCGADIDFSEDEISKNCPYCNTPLVVKALNIIKPSKIIPFYIDSKQGREIFKKWLGSLWFAPNDLKKLLHYENQFNPTYVPFFSYDSSATTHYTGQRGDIYYVQVTKRVYVDGKEQYITEMEPRIRWSFVANTIYRNFSDVLIYSKSDLPNVAKNMNRYDLNTLVNYNPSFLSGYRSFEYNIELRECYKVAKEYMNSIIYKDILWDIGGDEQRVDSQETSFSNEAFDVYMLPMWISQFKYNGKQYSIVVNGATGEIMGDRPYSNFKIFALIFVILLIAGGFFYFSQYYDNGGDFETNFHQEFHIPKTQNY